MMSPRKQTETPSWDELASLLEQKSPPTPSPVLTFYRDSNGWCPFCERVWIALEIKGIPYKESFVHLRNKPDWFLEMVPTGAVPALMMYDERENGKSQRTLLWESMDIIKALDELFPDTEKLIVDDLPQYKEGEEIVNRLYTASFDLFFSGKDATAPFEEKMKAKANFESTLD
jgi:glutathione S-transferase